MHLLANLGQSLFNSRHENGAPWFQALCRDVIEEQQRRNPVLVKLGAVVDALPQTTHV